MSLSNFEVLTRRESGELFTRYTGNPILTADGWPYPCNAVFNPAATRLASGETLLLVRVEDRRGFSHLTAARSHDGLTDWHIDPEPTLLPDPEHHEEEIWGIEDPRIVWPEDLGCYAVIYTAFSDDGPLVAMACTQDFKTFERKGAVMPPEDKNAALFPRRIDGHWVLVHRPAAAVSERRPHIWISRSRDLKYWSEPRPMLDARRGGWWDQARIGLGCPPIETPDGWLIVYHGVRRTVAGDLYRVGLALVDLDDPCKVIRRGAPWVLGPQAPYERNGDVPNVVFPCGHVVDEATNTFRLYYGAADTCVAVATAPFSDLLDWLKTHG